MNFKRPFEFSKKIDMTFESILPLIIKTFIDEQKDMILLNYLINFETNIEVKTLINRILYEDLKHCKYLQNLYKNYTSQEILYSNNEILNNQFLDDSIKKAKLNKLDIIKNYQNILSNFIDQDNKSILSEIIIDKLIHIHLYDYILSKTNVLLETEKLRQDKKKTFTLEEASIIAKKLGIDFSKEKFDLEQFRKGLDVELEHGKVNPLTNVSNDDEIITGKIAWAHLNEIPDYYTRLLKMEKEAKK